MGNLLYFIAVMLVILWAIGYFILNTGAIIHLLLPLAVFMVILKLLRGNRTGKHPSFKPMELSIKK
ncbi:MAG: lmo0937 family membrane protein [Chitinophagales bacterium]|nr:lmo0937 family membrane protein [Chitinophagales bacterium]